MRWLAPLTAGAVALGLTGYLLHVGICMTPDGWAYWQGSVSMLRGRGYHYFIGGYPNFIGGYPIIHWPPLYALYLAAWQWLLGVSGQSLADANAVLAGVAAFVWCFLFLQPVDAASAQRTQMRTVLIVVFVAAFVSFHYRALLSENLQLVLLPGLLHCTWRASIAPDRKTLLRHAALAGLVCASLLLTHNIGVAFLAAACVVTVTRRHDVRSAANAAAVMLALGLLPWIAVRACLGQAGSHVVGLGQGRFSAAEYGWQALDGLAYLMGPPQLHGGHIVVGLIVLLISAAAMRSVPRFIEYPKDRERLLFYAQYALAAAVLEIVAFSLVRVNDPLSVRFLLFVPLACVPIAVVIALGIRSRVIAVAVLLVLVVSPILRVGRLVANYHLKSAGDRSEYQGFIKPYFTIAPDFTSGVPREVGSQLLIAPLPYVEDRTVNAMGDGSTSVH